MKVILYTAVIGFILTSCSQKITLQKRKYNKGFYIAASGGKGTAKTGRESKQLLVTKVEQPAKEIEVTAQEPDVAEASADNKTPYIKTATADTRREHTLKSVVQKQALAPLEFIKTVEKKNEVKRNAIKTRNRKGPLFDFLANVYMGYLVVAMLIAIVFVCVSLFALYPAPVAIGYIALILLGLIILAAIGRAAT